MVSYAVIAFNSGTRVRPEIRLGIVGLVLDTRLHRSAPTAGAGARLGRHCGVHRREVAHHRLVVLRLVRVDSLGMLPKIVEA